MITFPTYNQPQSFRQFLRNALQSTFKNISDTENKTSINLSGYRFLIISNDPFTSFVFGRYIEKWNGKVDIAATEAQALEDIYSRVYNAIFIDIKSDKTNGTDLLSASLLDTLSKDQVAPAIALIDEKTDDLKASLIKAGIEDWIEKEIKPTDLSAKLLFYTS